MGLRRIFTPEGKDGTYNHGEAPTTRQRLNRDAISALFWIILTALLGIIVLSMWGAALRYGLFQGENPVDPSNSSADEALSILGNIGAAAIGGLVGWLTRDQLDTHPDNPQPTQTVAYAHAHAPNPEENTMPGIDETPTNPTPGGDVNTPDHPDELDTEEDPDLVWEDEPVDDDDDNEATP